ncbi:MAG: hypothetical protein D6820_07715 [Lentisphaerae bacterium]|nr:MAG: hypothetical protein D6820_07715 [Lentisphaerota bacterium]
MALRALNMLELQPPKPFAFMERVDENFLVQLTLDLDWTTPWHSSINVLHAATPVILRGDGDFSRFFQVLEGYQAENGGWGEHSDPHHQMAGAFHFLPFYRAAGRVFPRLEALARLVLALPIHGVGFGTMDMMAVLLFAMERGAITRDECERFFREVENVVRRCPLPEKRHDLLAYVQILAYLSRYAGDKAARDAWAPELWRLP